VEVLMITSRAGRSLVVLHSRSGKQTNISY
jgi:hypothetical protein